MAFPTSQVSYIRKKRVFYVDATDGSDSNDGRSPTDAWQTISKINGGSFLPGDIILFKRGETWTGTTLIFPSSGKEDAPIVLSAYGVGADPIINGNNTVNCIEIVNKSNIQLRNLEVAQGLNFGIYVHANSNGIQIIKCISHSCGNDNINFIDGAYNCKVYKCKSYDAYERVVGPRISCLEISDDCHDIIVQDCEFYGSESTGIAIHNHAATEFPYNITIRNCNSHDNDDFGIIFAQSNASPSPPAVGVNILIDNCKFNDNANVGSGGGIWFSNTGNTYPVGIVFDRCESISDYERPVYIAGRAIFKRCIFDAGWQSRIENGDEVIFYNCTFYRVGAVAFDVYGATDGLIMRNCIIFTEGNVPISIVTGSNIDINYMIYEGSVDIETNNVMNWMGTYYNWANWKSNSGMDADSPTPADPLFVDAASNDFRLQEGSPAIDKGIDVGLPFLGSKPDLGRWERGLD